MAATFFSLLMHLGHFRIDVPIHAYHNKLFHYKLFKTSFNGTLFFFFVFFFGAADNMKSIGVLDFLFGCLLEDL